VVFLPEELEYGLQLKSDYARRCFHRRNGDLLSVHYWLGVQRALQRGEVPELRMYPNRAKLGNDPVGSQGADASGLSGGAGSAGH